MHSRETDLNELLRHIAVFNSEHAYVQLFNVLFPVLKRFSFTLLKCHESAEEVASDTLYKLWEKRAQLIDVKNIKIYALVLARNQSLNILKQQSKKEVLSLDDIDIEVIFDSPSPEQILIYEELQNKLKISIDTLPNKCKMVFKLIKEEGLSYKETAELLNISVKTVDAHLVSAIKKITIALKVEFNLG
jgi:RNA polymerase sigma-70 factor (family 1)